MKRVDLVLALSWTCVAAPALATGLAGCNAQPVNDPDLNAPTATSSSLQDQAGAAAAPAALTPGTVDDLVANQWAVSVPDCGLHPQQPATPEQIMAGVPPGQRAAAIRRVLKNVPLSPARVERLLQLLGHTTEAPALEGLSETWASAAKMVDRYHVEVYEPQVARDSGDLTFQVSPEFRANAVGAVRRGVVSGASRVAGQGAVPVLVAALDDTHPAVRAEAIMALARRPDFTDRDRLKAARATLPGAWRQVEESLAK